MYLGRISNFLHRSALGLSGLKVTKILFIANVGNHWFSIYGEALACCMAHPFL